MTTILAVHSHGGGTGKSTLAANLATLMAIDGNRVCVVDTNVQAPGLHVLLGIDEGDIRCTLSDYLLGECEIDGAVHDVTDRLPASAEGTLHLVPARLNFCTISDIVGGGYDAGMLDEGIRMLVEKREPDVLLLDTPAGLANETMVALAAADLAVIIIRVDEQEYQGASVASSAAQRLTSPRSAVVVNMVTSTGDSDGVRRRAESVSEGAVEAVIPHSTELAQLASRGIFVLEHPDHPLTEQLRLLAKRLLDDVRNPG